MKKIYICASLMLLTFMGCQKELVQVPTNSVNTPNAYNTQADFTNAILGVYAGLSGADFNKLNNKNYTPNYYGGADGGSMGTTPDVLSDNLILNQQGRKSEQDFFNIKYTGNNTWDMWSNAYLVILRCNLILNNIGHLPSGAFKNNIQGEALAVRALAHFDLLRLYAKSYTSALATDLGVPYVTSTDPNLLPSRTPVKTAYDMVVADFIAAQGMINIDNGVSRMNKAAVEGLMSRVYLYRGEWQNCITAATNAIAHAPAANALASITDFPNIWIDATEADVLFKVKIVDADNITIGVGYEQASPQGVKPEYSVDFAYYNLFANNDVRKNAYIGTGAFNGVNYNYVKKYIGRTSGNANVVDYKVIRMGEVYLNRAEAYYNANNQASALADLNILRANRYTGFVNGTESGVPLYNTILLQRRLELGFEGSRFFDIKRLNLPITRSTFGDNADGTGTPAAVQTVAANSDLFQLPIPVYEINVNKNIVQNPGY